MVVVQRHHLAFHLTFQQPPRIASTFRGRVLIQCHGCNRGGYKDVVMAALDFPTHREVVPHTESHLHEQAFVSNLEKAVLGAGFDRPNKFPEHDEHLLAAPVGGLPTKCLPDVLVAFVVFSQPPVQRGVVVAIAQQLVYLRSVAAGLLDVDERLVVPARECVDRPRKLIDSSPGSVGKSLISSNSIPSNSGGEIPLSSSRSIKIPSRGVTTNVVFVPGNGLLPDPQRRRLPA